MSKIIMYTTHCPTCKAVEMRLHKYNVQYEEFTDIDAMVKLGITTVPVLEVDGIRLKAKEAIKWVEDNFKNEH